MSPLPSGNYSIYLLSYNVNPFLQLSSTFFFFTYYIGFSWYFWWGYPYFDSTPPPRPFDPLTTEKNKKASIKFPSNPHQIPIFYQNRYEISVKTDIKSLSNFLQISNKPQINIQQIDPMVQKKTPVGYWSLGRCVTDKERRTNFGILTNFNKIKNQGTMESLDHRKEHHQLEKKSIKNSW